MLEILLIVLIVLLLFGGFGAYQGRWGGPPVAYGSWIIGVLLVVLLVWLLLDFLPHGVVVR